MGRSPFRRRMPLTIAGIAFPTVPDLVFTLVVSLVSAYVLIPRLAGLVEEGDKRKARELVSQTASFLLFGAGAIALVAAFVAPHVLFVLFPAFEGSSHQEEFIFLSRLLLLQPILLGLSSIFSSVTQLHRRFFLPRAPAVCRPMN